MDETDLTANTAGTIVMDQNGQKCALIRVETTQTGFSFDAGSLSVVSTEQKVGEIWVYVQEGTKRLTISHPQLGVLKDYDLGQTLKRAKTYVMSLKTAEVVTVVKQDRTSQFVVFQIKPTSKVSVELNGEKLEVEDGVAMKKVDMGTYDYRIEAPGYVSEVGKVTVDDPQNKKLVNVTLKKDLHAEELSFNVKGNSFVMKRVDGGTFKMGPTLEYFSGDEEQPVQQVTLPAYYIGETLVTQGLWEAVMGNNPSTQKGAYFPVQSVSWDDCQKFLQALSKATGRNFRMPTEAEWEYAARGGNKSKGYKYSGSNVLNEVAWNKRNFNMWDWPNVKAKKPNELGIYDMTGYVWEWCQKWDGSKVVSGYVSRGGSWSDSDTAEDLLVNVRNTSSTGREDGFVGLRLVSDDK